VVKERKSGENFIHNSVHETGQSWHLYWFRVTEKLTVLSDSTNLSSIIRDVDPT
jgi:hypothetical protein